MEIEINEDLVSNTSVREIATSCNEQIVAPVEESVVTVKVAECLPAVPKLTPKAAESKQVDSTLLTPTNKFLS